MLGKLVKYDFKAMSKSMFPIFAVLLATTIILALQIRFHTEEGFIFVLSAALYSASITATGIGTLICVVNRFRNGLLKNEGYLSFALPVKTGTHIAAKVINAIIWGLMEALALLLSTIIMALIVGSVEDIAYAFRELMRLFDVVDRDVIIAFFKALTIMTLELISSTCLVYAAYAIAHLFDKHKNLIVVGFIIVITIVRSYILPYAILMKYEIFLYLIPIVFTALYCLLTWYILDKRLNLE